MNALLQNLEAAISEIEEFAVDAAEQVGDSHWQQRNVRIVTVADRDREVADYAIVECIDHIVRNDPARVLRRVARDRKLLARHFLIYRDIGWMEDGDERMEELPVCGHCVPKHSWFKNRSDVPLYPCADVRDLAEDYDIEVES